MDRKAAEYVIQNCACFYFRSASRIVTQVFDRSLAPLGLRSTQLVILVLLEYRESMSFSALAKELSMDQTSLSRMARPLVREEWITIEQGRDRRVRKLKLTPKGSRMIDRAAPLWQKAQSKIVQCVGEGEFSQLKDRLAKMARTAKEFPEVHSD